MKLNFNRNILLLMCVVAVLGLCVMSVMAPLQFDRQRQQREQLVKQRLLKIRTAEEGYKKMKGVYCARLDSLVSMGLLNDSAQFIPFSNKKRFQVEVSVLTDKTGNEVPVMTCGATFAEYLQGLDKHEVAQLTDNAYAMGQYPGLSFGSIEQFNGNVASWE